MAAGGIPSGLEILMDAISPTDESQIISWLNSQPWSGVTDNPKARQVQQYGYTYAYTGGPLTVGNPMTGPILYYAEVFRQRGWMNARQCIVNRYTQTQGISAHIDRKTFGPIIMSISLGADAVMTFRRGAERYDLLIPRLAALRLTGEARYEWTHEISSAKSYLVPGTGMKVVKPVDYCRYSLTYREVTE